MLGQQRLEPLVLLLYSIAFTGGLGEDLLQAEDFLLEGFDVLLLAFTVRTGPVSAGSRRDVGSWLTAVPVG